MKTLQSSLLIIGSAAMALMGTTCTSDMYGSGPASQRGSVTGGLTGVALGAIVGNQSGRPLEGAAKVGSLEPLPVQHLEMLRIRKMDTLHRRDIIDLHPQ